MMKKIVSLLFFSFVSVSLWAQDNCANATRLCANNTVTSTTVGATAAGSDPALNCGDFTVQRSVWFSVLAINNGSATITVTQINNIPGLEMEVYTGICGSLTTTGACASGNGPAGSMNVTFATTAGTTYYIMVDGTGGNQEAFRIQATTLTDALIASPDADFIADPVYGCIPLDVALDSTTVTHGGTNITFSWQIDGGSFMAASGQDTTITFNSIGTHFINLSVCNNECGCQLRGRSIVAQDLFPTIFYDTTVSNCMNTSIDFSGDALVLPDPPTVPANVTNWSWDFGDPGSGVNNTASGQLVSHTFVGPGTTFMVQLTVDGTCGPDIVTTIITLKPEPVVTAGPDQFICDGNSATLTATLLSGASPVQTYNWIAGSGTLSCSNCSATTVDFLPPGGPYSVSLDIVDANGCVADTTVNITVVPKPTVDAGTDSTTCPYDPVTLVATPLSGIPPFTYDWSPPTDLDDPTLQSPTATVNADASYCVTVTDSLGCTSDAACVNIFVYPPPAITPLIPILCATNPSLVDTFTVSGAGFGSTYSWLLSPDYSLINGANSDSSSVYVTFPTGIAATYNFIAIVTDGVTGCIDTVTTSFTVIIGLNMSVSGSTELCFGQSATLTATGALNYAWTANPAYPFADSTLASQTVSPAVSTIFIIYGTAGTCSQVITDTLRVHPLPIATTAGIPDFCGCATVTLNGLGSTPGMSYLWTSFGGATIANPNAQITTSTICSSETFVFIVTDTSTGCSMSDTTTANALPDPVSIVDVSPSVICQGTPTLITLDGTGSSSGAGISYQWTASPPVLITNDTLITASATVSTQTVFYLTVTDALGCDSTASDTVFIYPPPTISATPAFLCTSDLLESSIDINGASPGSAYSWDTIPPCVLPGSATGSSQLFDFSTCGTGSYNFSVTVNDAITGCITILSQTVTIITGVNMTVSNDTTICEGSSVTLTASGANSFLWSTTDTTSSVTLGSLTAAGSPYQFIVIGTVGSCTGSDTINVTVTPVPVTSPITGSISVCASDTSIVYSVTPIVGNYIWSVSGGSISSGQGTNTIFVNWGGAGLGVVSVFDSSASGCVGATQTLNVIINPLPVTPAISGQDSVCANSTTFYFITPNAGSTYSWTVTGGAISGSPTGSFISVIWGAVGTGSVSVSEMNAVGCSGVTQTLSIVINPVPVLLTILGNSNLCQGDTMQLYNVAATAGSIYTWTVSGGTLVSGQGNDSILVNWGVIGFGSIDAVETNLFGCSSTTSTLFVTLNTMPVATVFPDSANVCNNSPYPVLGSSNIGAIQWLTSGSGTFDDTTIATPLYTPGITDTAYVTLTMVLSSPPCQDDTATIVLHFTVPPVVTLTATQSAICVGDSVTLTATGGGSYAWTPGGDTTAVVVDTPVVSTMYTVTVSTGPGCNTSDSVFITVDSIPVTSPIFGADSVCESDTSVLYTILPHVGNYIWTVTGGSILSGQGTDSMYVNWGASGSGTISVIDTNAAGCASLTQNLNVVISAIPSTSPITGLDTVCENSSIPYFVTSTAGSTYNWTVIGGSISGSPTASLITVIWGTAGPGFVSVIETNAAGCSDTAQTMNVVINPIPLPVLIQGNSTLCEGDSIQLYYTPVTAGSTYNWSVTGGTLVSGQGTDSIIVNWGVAGVDSVIALETNSFGCTSDTSVFLVTLNPHPVASVLPDSGTVCQGSTFTVFGTVNVGTIHWLTSGTGTFDDTTIASPVYTPGFVDTGYVTLSMILSNSPCPDDTAIVVVYVSPSPVVAITASQTTICFADSDTLSATGIGYFVWTPGGDTTSTIIVSPVVTTTYYVTVTNSFNCSTSDSVVITVIPPGIPNGGADQIVCIDDTATLNGTYQNAGGLQWSTLGDGTFLPDSISPSVIYVPGTNDSTAGGVQIVVVTTGACLNLTDTVNISIYQFPSALAGTDTLLTGGPIAGETVPLNGLVLNAAGGVWTTSGTGIFSPDNITLNVIYTPSVQDYDLDSVIITLITVGGCRVATDYLVINFSPFDIPNVFTPYPTSPGFNDYFVIKNLPPGSKLSIWDRWGMLVYVSDYYRNDWDAAELKADTYYYSLTTDKKEYRGFIRVIREE